MEFTHRLTSGVALVAVIILLIAAWRTYPQAHPVRQGALFSMIFMVLEALIGAGLVLFRWVADDQSIGRIFSISLHLVNTFLLLASLALTAWWASGGAPVRLPKKSFLVWFFGICYAGVILLGISGAITALGDTLFPVESLREGVRQDFSQSAHFLVRLRIWHPVIAIVVGLLVLFISLFIALDSKDKTVRRLAGFLGGAFILQLGAGLVNVLLLAPVAMQMIHLLLADSVWIGLVLFAAAVFKKTDDKSRIEPKEA